MLLTRLYLLGLAKLSLAFFAGLVAVDFVFRFVKYLEMAASNKVSGSDVWALLAIKLGLGSAELLPLALYLATFSWLIALRRTNEYTAMLAGGFSATRMLKLTVAIAALGALITGLNSLLLAPEGEARVFEIRTQSENDAELAGIKPGVFREFTGGSTFFAEQLADSNEFLKRAFVAATNGAVPSVSHSSRAYLDTQPRYGDRAAVFADGRDYRGSAGSAAFSVTEFERYNVRMEHKPVVAARSHESFRPTAQLMAFPTPANAAELHWRLALPVAALVMPLLAFAIGIRTSPQDWQLNLVLSMALYFVYKNVLGIGREWLEDGVVPTALGLWWVHALLIIPTAFLLYWELRPRTAFRQSLRAAIPAPLR